MSKGKGKGKPKKAPRRNRSGSAGRNSVSSKGSRNSVTINLPRAAKPRKSSLSKPRPRTRSSSAGRVKGRRAATLEEQYLYGFIDPENASSGPGDGMYATYVAKHRAYADYTVKTLPCDAKSGLNVALLDPVGTNPTSIFVEGQLNGGPNTSVFYDGAAYRNKETDEITFVASPHIPRSYQGKTIYTGPAPAPPGNPAETSRFVSIFSPGFVVSQNIMGQPVYANYWKGYASSTASVPVPQEQQNPGAWCKPLPAYDIDLYAGVPSQRNVFTSQATGVDLEDFAASNFTPMVQFRLTGVKLQVQCFTNVFSNTGMVVGGDNKTLFGTAIEDFRHDNADLSYVGSTFLSTQTVVSDTDNTFTGPMFSQTRKNLGPLISGQTYETVFVPATDHITKWRTSPGICAALATNFAAFKPILDVSPCDGLHQAVQTWDDYLMNNPAAFLTFTGVPEGSNFRVKTTIGIEYVVLNNTALSLVRDAARLNRRFQPDWSAITACCGAAIGEDMCCAQSISMCSAVRHGAQAAAGLLPKVIGRRPDPAMYAIGATNSALHIKATAPQTFGSTSDAKPAETDDIVETEVANSGAWERMKSMMRGLKRAMDFMPRDDMLYAGASAMNYMRPGIPGVPLIK